MGRAVRALVTALAGLALLFWPVVYTSRLRRQVRRTERMVCDLLDDVVKDEPENVGTPYGLLRLVQGGHRG